MMIDIDDDLIMQTGQAGPVYVAAFDDEGGVVIFADVRLHEYAIRAGQDMISRWDAVMQHDIGLFAETA